MLSRRKDPHAPKKVGFVQSWGDHLKEATKEPDGKTPSSARIYAGWLIAFVLFLQFSSTFVVLWKVLRLAASEPNAPALVLAYTALLRVLLLWGTLFDVATALSLYGINVWKYISTFVNPLAAASIGVTQGIAGGLGAGFNTMGGIGGMGGFGGYTPAPGPITPSPISHPVVPAPVKPTVNPAPSPVTLHPSLVDAPDEDRT